MHSSQSVNLPLVILSILVTALCWGVYGPLLQWGHHEMGSGRLRPFIFVGIAYLVVAVIGPVVVMALTGMERGDGIGTGWTMGGVWWSFIAGTAGAIGALGMILAFNFGGKPHYVPPLIFGLAPVVNAFFTISMNPQLRMQLSASPIRSSCFGAGLLMVALGAVIVLVSAPKGGPKPAAAQKPAVDTPEKGAAETSATPEKEASKEDAGESAT